MSRNSGLVIVAGKRQNSSSECDNRRLRLSGVYSSELSLREVLTLVAALRTAVSTEPDGRYFLVSLVQDSRSAVQLEAASGVPQFLPGPRVNRQDKRIVVQGHVTQALEHGSEKQCCIAICGASIRIQSF